MRSLRTLPRISVAFLALSAYAVAIDRCTLAAAYVETAEAPSHEDCPDHGSSGGSEGDVQCCKTFPTPWVAPGKKLVSLNKFRFAAVTYASVVVARVQEMQTELRPLELDVGPPFAMSFVESVLQRSILAHAPPVALG